MPYLLFFFGYIISNIFFGTESIENKISYDFSTPDKIYSLPEKLKEVSGLGYMGDGKIACIQDEAGNLYIYNTATEKVERTLFFATDGDYEGLARKGSAYYVANSSGTIFKSSAGNTTRYKTELTKDNNIEGLCYDKTTNSLLILCKDEPGAGIGGSNKAIYSFSLATNKLIKEPFLVYDPGDLDFRPSGIEINPIDNSIYILSSKGHLAILENKKIKEIITLSGSHFNQSEGLTFNEKGDLFISNEGKKGSATILLFKIKN